VLSIRCLHILNYPRIVLLQCELSALRRNHETFSAENETCRNTSNCFRRWNRNRNRISVGL